MEAQGKGKKMKTFGDAILGLVRNKDPNAQKFEGNEFNYNQVSKEFLMKKRQEILKWTKTLYCQENRIVVMDKSKVTFNKKMLMNLINESDE